MHESLTDRAYRLIVKKLSSGQLPLGGRMSNRALAKELGIGFVPVREALIRLASERLIEHRPGQGTFVPEPRREEIVELYDLREALECHAVAKLAGHLDEASLAEMTRYVDELSVIADDLAREAEPTPNAEQRERWGQADVAFHATLLRAAGNRRALETVLDVRLLTRVFSRGIQHEPLAGLYRTRDEHRRILDVLRHGGAEDARREMAGHIRRGCRMVLEDYDRRRMQPPRHRRAGSVEGAALYHRGSVIPQP